MLLLDDKQPAKPIICKAAKHSRKGSLRHLHLTVPCRWAWRNTHCECWCSSIAVFPGQTLLARMTGWSLFEAVWMCRVNISMILIQVVVSNNFCCHPYLGKWSILTHVFQMGWNHQPVMLISANDWQLLIPPMNPPTIGPKKGVASVKKARSFSYILDDPIPYPLGSVYGRFTYIYHKFKPHGVYKYSKNIEYNICSIWIRHCMKKHGNMETIFHPNKNDTRGFWWAVLGTDIFALCIKLVAPSICPPDRTPAPWFRSVWCEWWCFDDVWWCLML